MSDNAENKTAMQIAAALADDIYKDGLRPSIVTIGETLDGVFKAIGHYPRYWGMMSDVSLEEKQKKFRENVQKKYAEVPEENRMLPNPNILVPTFQIMEYAILDDDISEMFASLLAAASDKTKSTHPAFVGVLKDLSPSDARCLNAIWLLPGVNGRTVSFDKSESFLAVKSRVVLNVPSLRSYSEAVELSDGVYWLDYGASMYSLKGQVFYSLNGWIMSRGTRDANIEASIDNLIRLGLLEYRQIKSSIDESLLEDDLARLVSLADGKIAKALGSDIEKVTAELVSGEQLKLTSFGYNFASCCAAKE